MEGYKKLLVIADPEDKTNKSLNKALHLARHTGAQITVLLVVFDPLLELLCSVSKKYRTVIDVLIKDKQRWLDDQLAKHKAAGEVINDKVVWNRHLHLAVEEQLSQFHYDLVIKGFRHHNEVSSLLITPTDWHLLRECPCPVLLVKSTRWTPGGHILSAIGMDQQHEESEAINNKIIIESQHLARALDADIHLVNSYFGEDINMYISPPENDKKIDVEKIKKQHLSDINEIVEQYKLAKENTHVIEGMPDNIIPMVAKKIDARVVIIGTGDRSGLSESLLGHTAEHIVEQLDCDLLALKTDQLQSEPRPLN